MNVREWSKLQFMDPVPILVGLREIALSGHLDGMPKDVASLRTRELRPFLEGRQCALFSYLIGKVIGAEVRFAQLEKSDYDFVAHFEHDAVHNFVPVQLKELVPSERNARLSLQEIVDGLKIRYKDSKDLTVAIHINRDVLVRPSELDLRGLNIGELWMYGATSHEQSTWRIIGNLMSESPRWMEFSYPGA